MIYQVIEHFIDLQDQNYKYSVGDKFPHDGYEPSAERIAELLSDTNRRKRPVIAAVEEDVPETAEAEEVDAPEPITEEEPAPSVKQRKGRKKNA